MCLNFRGTKLWQITNLLNIRGLYFHRSWERIDMVDHLVPGYLMKRCPYLYFLSNTQATTEHGALFGVHFLMISHTFARNTHGLNYSWMVYQTAKTAKVLSLENLNAYSMVAQLLPYCATRQPGV